MSLVYIYGLVDPRDGSIRYVGRTIQDPVIRLRAHISEGTYPASICSQKQLWIKELLDIGATPDVIVLEQVEEELPRFGGLAIAEQKWITSLLERGEPLLNGFGSPSFGQYIKELNQQRRPQPPKPIPAPPDQMSSDEIRTRRMALGLSQYQLAKAIGYNHSTVSRWETGSRIPPPGLSLLFDRLGH